MKRQTLRRPLSRITTVSLSATLAMGALVACSPGGDGSVGEDGDVTITFVDHYADPKKNIPAVWAAIQDFESKNPGITVELKGDEVATHLNNMVVAAQSGNLPDMFWINDANARDMFEAGVTMDVTEMKDSLDLESRFSGEMLSQFSMDGKQYALPYTAIVTGFYYNKTILDEFGLEVPQSADDLLMACEKLHAVGVTPIAQGFNGSTYSIWAFTGMLQRFGYMDRYEEILAGDDSYANDDFRILYEYIQKMHDVGCFSDNATTQSYTQAMNEFAQGNAAFVNSTSSASTIVDSSKVESVDVGFWAGPTFSDGVGDQQMIVNVPAAPIAFGRSVADDPAKIEAVKKFVEYWYSDAGQQILAAEGGLAPATTYTAEIDPAKRPAFAAVLDVVEQASADGWWSPRAQVDSVVPTSVQNAMYDSFNGLVTGDLDADAALDIVQKAIDAAR
ncbi:ABC transporter substrate-binding protein [Microbacterium murale]|uniref:Sugar ABC transporter substrate-binding protein n=1 Tax=Microbacterium murale TaxID=1081040 RepID=A0ABQ1S2S2_9MICO|nr:ABC transporter substrate-binding protein [Microbacterium murale]GGD89118.1 sugar ABC transporter substrate-binding protein [Microbacterium murale]